MNQLQANLYQMLTEIDDLCREHDIQYFLAGGTALGAVRNHGFLPWDDDIDIYITRNNWKKLRTLIEEKPNLVPEGRSFVYEDNTEYYFNPIPRYVDTTTTTMYKSQILCGKALGQHIEFLIMDPMPNGEKERNEYVRKLRLYTELITPYFVVNKNIPVEEYEDFYREYRNYLRKIKIRGKEKVLEEFEQQLFVYPEETCDLLCMRWGIEILQYRKKDFGKGRLEEFEGRKFPVGESAEGIFRCAYGDSWMFVPSAEGQIVHNALRDVERPFQDYSKDLEKKINKEKILKAYEKNKRNSMGIFMASRKREKFASVSKNLITGKRIADELEQSLDQLKSLLKEKKYDDIQKMCAEYCTLQNNRFFRKYDIRVPVSDEVLDIITRMLVIKEKYYLADRFLRIRAKSGELSPILKIVEKLIAYNRELSILKYDKKDRNAVEKHLNKATVEEKELLCWKREKLITDFNNNIAAEQIREKCMAVLSEFPDDGETMELLGDVYKTMGRNKEAEKMYAASIKNTRNGLLWDRVLKKTGINRLAQI